MQSGSVSMLLPSLKTPLIFNLRQYHEFDAENRWQGDATIASATLIGEARKPLGDISQFEASSLAQPEGSPALAANLASFGKASVIACSPVAAISWAKPSKTGCSMPVWPARASTPPQHPGPRSPADRCGRHLPLLDLTVFADANRMHQSPELASADWGCADKNRQHP